MEQSSRSPSPIPARTGASSSLLLLDDDNDFRVALAANLRDDGYHVREFSSPVHVPDSSLLNVDAVVTDDQMPGEDGLTFTDRLQARHPNVPVVMVTAFVTHHLESQVERRPRVRLLPKPFDYETLLSLLVSLLAG